MFLDYSKNRITDETLKLLIDLAEQETSEAALDKGKAQIIKLGDRVATMAWNTWRHLEVWYGILGIGAVYHTVNPRLFDDQLSFIVNDAEDRVILYDRAFAPIVERLRPDDESRRAERPQADDGAPPKVEASSWREGDKPGKSAAVSLSRAAERAHELGRIAGEDDDAAETGCAHPFGQGFRRFRRRIQTQLRRFRRFVG